MRLELRLGCPSRPVSNVKLATLSHEHRQGARPRRPSRWGRSRAGPGRLPPPRRQGPWGVQVCPLSHALSRRGQVGRPGRAQLRTRMIDRTPGRRSCSASRRGPPRVAGTVREKFRPGLGVGVPVSADDDDPGCWLRTARPSRWHVQRCLPDLLRSRSLSRRYWPGPGADSAPGMRPSPNCCKLEWQQRTLVGLGPLGRSTIITQSKSHTHHRGEFALVQVRGPGLSCLRPRFQVKLPLALV
jgi:hypothetical protein